MDERRRSPRFTVDNGVTGQIKPAIEVKVINISEHGLMIESPSGLPPAGICELTINTPSGPKKVRARVARCRAQMVKRSGDRVAVRFHAGLEFLDDFAAGPEVRDLISELCTLEVAGEPRRIRQAM